MDKVKILIENHFLTEKGFDTINQALNLAVLSNKKLLKRDLEKSRINATFQNCLQGHPMPDIPEMGTFWDRINFALPKIYAHNKDPEKILKTTSEPDDSSNTTDSRRNFSSG